MRTLSVSSDMEKVGMIEGRKQPILSVLPVVRLSRKKKDLRRITASPPLVRKHVAVESPEVKLPPLPRVQKRPSEPTSDFIEKEPSKFESDLLTREARMLVKTCEELFPGDPLVLGPLQPPLPTRLVYQVPTAQTKPTPKRTRKPYVASSILETLLDYDDAQIPPINVKGLEQAKSLNIERGSDTTRRSPVINTPATLNLPSVRKLDS